MIPIVEIRDVSKSFKQISGSLLGGDQQRRRIHALRQISFTIRQGESLGIVGESGSGKTTLARLIAKLDTPDSGGVFFRGHELKNLSSEEHHSFRQEVRMIFQNPSAALNPGLTVQDMLLDVAAQLGIPTEKRFSRIIETLRRVGISTDYLGRFPSQLSSGQRKRIGIARGLLKAPRLLIADEPLAGVDASQQLRIIDVMKEIQVEQGMALLVISHDLRLVRRLSNRIAVMYEGEVVQFLDTSKNLLQQATHPFAKQLLAASSSSH